MPLARVKLFSFLGLSMSSTQRLPTDIDGVWVHIPVHALASRFASVTLSNRVPYKLRGIAELEVDAESDSQCRFIGSSSFSIYAHATNEQKLQLVRDLVHRGVTVLESASRFTFFASEHDVASIVLSEALERAQILDVILCSFGAKWPLGDFALKFKPIIMNHPRNIIDAGFEIGDDPRIVLMRLSQV